MALMLWCVNGCQPMCGLWECGMCGYEGPGLPEGETEYLLEANEETGLYERVSRDVWQDAVWPEDEIEAGI